MVEDDIAFQFIKSISKFRKIQSFISSNFDIKGGEFIVLSVIFDNVDTANGAGYIGFSEIQNCLHISKAALSQFLRPLERKGYIHRKTDPADRRRIMISLTATGFKTLKDLHLCAMKTLNEIITRFGRDNMITFLDMINKFADIALSIDK